MNNTNGITINPNGVAEENHSTDFFKNQDLSSLFKGKEYIQPVKLFYTINKKIPHRLIYDFINLDVLCEELKKKNYLQQQILSEDYLYHKKDFKKESLLVFVREDIIIFHSRETRETVIYYSDFSDTEIISDLKKIFLLSRKKPDYKNKICLICQDGAELAMNDFSIEEMTIDLEKNYNDDFLSVHEIIEKRLSNEKDKGLILLHGKPGTGKTTYLRYLLGRIRKAMIYVPPDFATLIATPQFLSFLLQHKNSVLIIEDAENIIQERRAGANGAISNLLNLCDGLLSECLNIQVICTFNNDISRVDKALLRKGRLIAQYEFGELETVKAQSLSDSLGFKTQVERPMTLAEIFNQNTKDFTDKKNKSAIGFKK